MSNTDFSSFKKSRQDSLSRLKAEVDKLNPQGFDKDEFWSPVTDKAGNGHAIIRFLPEPKGEDSPFVRYWDHAFKGPGGWYIERSLTSLGQPDPLNEYNQELWATEDKAKRSFVSKVTKRKLRYVSNILVIKHTARQEDEGQVFRYRYGKKIFDMINDKMHPQFEDEVGFNPFDFWEGANFNLKIRMVDKFPNYDKSSFDPQAELMNDDDLKTLWERLPSLKAVIDPAKFKSYEDLQARLTRVLKLNAPALATPPRSKVRDEEDAGDDINTNNADPEDYSGSSGDDEEANFFAKLRNPD